MNSLAKKTLIFALALVVVATVGWLGRKAYRAATERRLLAQAQQYLGKKDLHNASICLHRALQVNPWSVQASCLTADLMEAKGLPAALDWRIRATQLKPTLMDYRFAWAKSALHFHNLKSAEDALSGMDELGKSTANYHKLSGALAWESHHAAEAEQQYSEALRIEPTNGAVMLNLATIHLASTNAVIANAARASLVQMAAGTDTEIRNSSLHCLAEDAKAQKLYSQAIGYSQQLLRDPSATFGDRLVHLDLLREAKSSEAIPWLTSLEKEAESSPSAAFLFGKWIAAADSPAVALTWLRKLSPAVQTNQPVPLIITDCQVALKDWPALLALVNQENWGDLSFYRLALESLAQRGLGKDTASTAAWQKALRLATHRLDNLARLSQATAAWHWTPEHTEVLEKITTTFPKETWATDQLVAQLYAQGDTRGIEALLTRAQASDPSDPRLKNNLANVFLLRNTEVQKAYRLAKEAYDVAPENPFFASTYAYSLLLQNRSDDADKAFSHVKLEYLQIPSVAAYYGVVEAQCGHHDIAKGSLARADLGKLLPEEKELVRRAEARL